MTACKQCGADAPGIACEFCGAIQSPPKTLEDELAALQALARAAQHVAASTSDVKVGKNGTTSSLLTAQLADQRLVAFWGSAWVPTHPDAIVQVIQSSLAGVQFDEKVMGFGESRQLPHALLARAKGALDALEINAPSDPRVSQFRRKILERQAEGVRAKAKARNLSIALFAGLLVPFLGFAFVPTALKSFGGPDADAPIPTAMRGNWTRHDTVYNYSLRVADTSISWAYTLAEDGKPRGSESKIHQRGQGGLNDDGTFAFHAENCVSQFALMDTSTLVVSQGCGFASGTWTR